MGDFFYNLFTNKTFISIMDFIMFVLLWVAVVAVGFVLFYCIGAVIDYFIEIGRNLKKTADALTKMSEGVSLKGTTFTVEEFKAEKYDKTKK